MAQRNREKYGENLVIGADAHVERMRKSRGETKNEGGGNPTKEEPIKPGSDTNNKYRVSPGGSTVKVKEGQYTFKFRRNRYEGFDLGADPQVGEGEQGGTNRTKTLLCDNNPTPPLSTPNPGVNVTRDNLSTKQVRIG